MAIKVNGNTVIDDDRNLLVNGVGTSVISTNTNANIGQYYLITSAITLTLPANPLIGDRLRIIKTDTAGNPIVARNGSKIMGLSEDLTVDVVRSFDLVYTDETNGWVLV